MRRIILKRDNYTCQLCQVKCLGKKRNKPSPHIDHIIPRRKRRDLEMEPSNLRVLCNHCHSRITKLDQIAEGRPAIGLDGYPIENSA